MVEHGAGEAGEGLLVAQRVRSLAISSPALLLDKGPPQIDRAVERLRAAFRRSASRAPSAPAHRPCGDFLRACRPAEPSRHQALFQPGGEIAATPSIASEPIASTRACSAASKMAVASGDAVQPGVELFVVIGLAQGIGVAHAAHQGDFLRRRLRAGVGRRAFRPFSAGGSLEKLTSSSGSPASERTATATARLKVRRGFPACSTGTSPMFQPDPRLQRGCLSLTQPALWRRFPAIPRQRRAGRIPPHWRVPARRTC